MTINKLENKTQSMHAVNRTPVAVHGNPRVLDYEVTRNTRPPAAPIV